jgi:hypothetical protein
MAEAIIGTFTRGEPTKNFEKYNRENEQGRKETQYVPKDKAEALGTPDQIEVVIRNTQ